MSSRVSNVKLRKVGKKKILASGSFVLNDAIRINCLIISGKDGPFFGLPARAGNDKDGNKKMYYDVFIEDKELLKEISSTVMDKFENLVGKNVAKKVEEVNTDTQNDDDEDYPF